MIWVQVWKWDHPVFLPKLGPLLHLKQDYVFTAVVLCIYTSLTSVLFRRLSDKILGHCGGKSGREEMMNPVLRIAPKFELKICLCSLYVAGKINALFHYPWNFYPDGKSIFRFVLKCSDSDLFVVLYGETRWCTCPVYRHADWIEKLLRGRKEWNALRQMADFIKAKQMSV